MSPRRESGVLGRQKVGPTKPSGGGGSAKAVDRLATIIALAIVFALVATAGIIVVAMGNKAYRYMLSEERLVVETIEVEGIVVLTKDEIVQMSGIRKNQPMLELNLQAIATKIQAHPRVELAVVERHLPRRVLIKIKERVPIGLVQQSGELKGIDYTGTVVPLIPSREEIKAPILTGYDKAGVGQDLLKEALDSIELMRPDIVTRISEVRLDPSSGLTLLTTGSPVVIRLGRGEIAPKIERLRRALKLFDERGEVKEYIDVRFKDIVTRP